MRSVSTRPVLIALVLMIAKECEQPRRLEMRLRLGRGVGV